MHFNFGRHIFTYKTNVIILHKDFCLFIWYNLHKNLSICEYHCQWYLLLTLEPGHLCENKAFVLYLNLLFLLALH